MKLFIPVLLAFVAGFAAHLFLFSDLVPNSLFPMRPSAVNTARTGATIPTPEFAKSAVYIEYKRGTFTPTTAVSKVGNRIVIRNMDPDVTMWLDLPDANFLKTTRPYGLSEQIDVVPQTSGTYMVRNKTHEGATFTIIIKP